MINDKIRNEKPMTSVNTFLHTSDAACGVDRDGRIIFWNKAAEEAWGYIEDIALGQRCWELLCGRDVFGNQYCGKDCPIRASTFESNVGNHFQLDFLTAQGDLKRFTVNPLIMNGPSGEKMLVHLCHPETVENRTPTNASIVKQVTKPQTQSTLSSREIEVLVYLHKGLAIAEIAHSLGISVATVRNHTQHILLKLQVHSRFEAVAQARKLGLI